MDMIDIATLYECITRRWSPGIGDPSVMAWVTVGGYVVTGGLCLAAARVRVQDRRFWTILSVVLLFLAVNKQLDLQSALTATGRCISKMQGWYQDRKPVQFAFILALLTASVTTMSITLIRLRRHLGRIGIALCGFGILLTFVAIRAVGFHHFDQIIGMTLGNFRMNWVLELSGIVLIFVNAVWACGSRQPVRSPKPGGLQGPKT
ncbi:isopropylmalate isomerase [Roseovarius sp.]|uniref:isopropylmalate isomerase n=1 Tax=Roseovarius sp. TaxID=1486281 RepID=UPI003A9842F8